MHEIIKGLVISETDFGENNKYITILSEHKKYSVLCVGARKKGSRFLTCTRLFCYGEFTLFKKKSGYTLSEGEIITHFLNVSDDIEKYALACYLAQLSGALSEGDFISEELLTLLLWAIHVISNKDRNLELIRAAFELRAIAGSGYMPAFDACVFCRKDTGIKEPVFFIKEGVIGCATCVPSDMRHNARLLLKSVYDAIIHIISCEAKKVFSFTLGEETLKELSFICETYTLNNLGFRPKTLDFYKSIRS